MSARGRAYYCSVREVPETCPAVDEAMRIAARDLDETFENREYIDEVLAAATAKVKTQTEALRDALVSAIASQIELEEEVSALGDRVRELERELDDTRSAL